MDGLTADRGDFDCVWRWHFAGALLAWPRTLLVSGVGMPFMLLIPFFLLGIILLSILAGDLGLFRVVASRPPASPAISERLSILSTIRCYLPFHRVGRIGAWALGMRAMMVSGAGEDYVNFAEAKGLSVANFLMRDAQLCCRR
ncbi:MAG: hypothetical protein U0350_26570 [Caldilineaceae bacterium]